jgi:hypothetical protein
MTATLEQRLNNLEAATFLIQQAGDARPVTRDLAGRREADTGEA